MDEKILIDGPLSPDLISEVISSFSENKACGGHSVFFGQVRDDEYEGKKVEAIEYSAYESMVNKASERIIMVVMRGLSDVRKIKIMHSTGRVRAGEISLLVAVSASHRQQAMKACEMTVELIKAELPVWKKEIFSDNTSRWQENKLA